MIDTVFAFQAIIGMAVVTIFLRAVPFMGAAHIHKFPLLLKLGRFLPPAIMTLLLLHTARGSVAEHNLGFWPELVSVLTAILLQWRFRQPLISIFAATGIYVVIRNSL